MAKITVWNPWRMMPRDFFELDQDTFFNDDVQLDMYEDNDAYVIKAKAAGINKEDFKIEFKGNAVTITGNSNEEKEEESKDRKYYRKEIRNLSFTRTLDLPGPVDPEQANASFKNGVLTVTVPKSAEAKPKQITVNEG